ncbi:efflux RND transporter permease subunit [Alteromonas sp. ASW11-36]|uniref:Efflux RND transporter permease subunit n=1 Tax=Alteromonas arenosi TaxID=3055817 RepID=A0ABT7SUR1_9ALTE|nr:efflux RND transporter permease subunit [Alteromonas sp. ASW11-36]MDM7859927.1 efflux RND transporter permease subunit [Alteromonas sp. ASW11-36]
MKQRWMDLVIARPWLVMIVNIITVFALAAGAQYLYFRGDYKVFFHEDNPQRVAFEEMQNIFNKNENASIIIAPPNGDVFTSETLTLIHELTEAAWQTPLSTRVDSISNFQHTYSEYDDLMVESLIEYPEDLTAEKIAQVKQVALTEPNLVGRLVSEQGHVAVVNITVQLPDGDQTPEVTAINLFVRAMTDEFKQRYPEHEFHHTGMVMLNNAFQEAANQDASTLIPLMFLTIIVVMWLLLRSFKCTIATLIIVIFSIIATMGFAGWTGFYLSLSTVNVPTMVMTLAVADCIHVISSMFFAMRQGRNKEEAIRYSLDINLMPIVITSVTTAIGFLTLNFSAVPILNDLGNLTALGVMLACWLSLTFLPALLVVSNVSVPVSGGQHTWPESMANWVITYHKRILPYGVIAFAAAILLAFTNVLNDVAIEYFDQSSEFRQAADFQTENLSGMSTADFGIYTETPSDINKPENLQYIAAFSAWLRAQPEVDHVTTLSDTMKRLNKNMHADERTMYKLPAEKELAAQYLLLFEMSLPYGLDLNNQIDIDKSATRIMVTMQNLGSNEFVEFEQRALDWFAQLAPNLRITAASPPLMFAHIGETNMKSMIEGTLLALVLISGLLIFALRSLRMGLISLIPNMLPAGIGFGIWALISGQINMALAVVLSMTLGIIVDDTVHFLSKYNYARQRGDSAEKSVRYAFQSVGRALLITTVVLALGFAVLSLSTFALNEDMGLLTSIIIVVALIVDLIFLPAALLFFDRKQAPTKPA